jgi:hypothetical protein
MPFTSAGLPNGGKTAHYEISFDTTLPSNSGLMLASGLFDACEQDFALMASWFGDPEPSDLDVLGVAHHFPFPVQIVNNSSGNGATVNYSLLGLHVTLNANNGKMAPSVAFLRYLLVSEITEMFMANQDKGWFQGLSSGSNEGSKGEGLSLFLAVQLNMTTGVGPVLFPGFSVVPFWLNSGTSIRPNFVDNNPDDNNHDVITGCTTCFIYFLHNQLGFTIPAIVDAAADTLAGVYQNLTGKTNAWSAFSDLVNNHYPLGFTYHPQGDNIFPVSELSQFFAPNAITCGYSESTQIFIDKPAMAEVHIQLTSDNPAIAAPVSPSVTIRVGDQSATVTISAPPVMGPFPRKSVNIHATYAGKTLTMTVDVVPVGIASLALTPGTVVCGNPSTAKVTLDRPSLDGDVIVNLFCGAPAYATLPAPPTCTINKNDSFATFPITTPSIPSAFKTAQASIYATYGDSNASAQLTVTSKVVAGILNTLSVMPTTVTGGNISNGTVTLVEPVPTDTIVSIAVLEAAPGLPGPGNPSPVASVKNPQVLIKANQTIGRFTINTNRNLSPGTKRNVTIMAEAVVTKYAVLTVEL